MNDTTAETCFQKILTDAIDVIIKVSVVLNLLHYVILLMTMIDVMMKRIVSDRKSITRYQIFLAYAGENLAPKKVRLRKYFAILAK